MSYKKFARIAPLILRKIKFFVLIKMDFIMLAPGILFLILNITDFSWKKLTTEYMNTFLMVTVISYQMCVPFLL